MGTGLASSLPFHSAGDISAGLMECACQYVISSYTSTIKTLQYARKCTNAREPSHSEPYRLLAITMAPKPGENALKGVDTEISSIQAAMGPSTYVEQLPSPTVATAIARLQECDFAHFACHGISNSVDPFESGLVLQTPNTAIGRPRQDILSLRIISKAHLAKAWIAYLSACSTAQNRAVRLLDEVLHVVSGFQVAGFRHVVGCMWPCSNNVCVNMAKLFYAELSQTDKRGDPDRAVAVALHKAVKAIRESNNYKRRPLEWAQFAHFGA